MSRGPIKICPICKLDVGINAHTEQEATETLAKHIFKEHTKRKGGQAVLQVPDTMNAKPLKRLVGQPNRAQRRAKARSLKPWQRVAQ